MISFQIDESIRLTKCSTALTPSGLYDIDYALNPYIGCAHGCLYCYAPDILRSEKGEKWGSWVEAKTNISRILRKEIVGLRGVIIGLGTVTDPYQPAEKDLELTRACLEVMKDAEISLVLMTKSPIALRDLDIFNSMKDVEVCVTITTIDRKISTLLEPGAPSIEDRLRVLEKASEAGLRTTTLISPLLVSSDDLTQQVIDIAEQIYQTGCRNISFDRMRLRSTAIRRIENRLRQSSSPIDCSMLRNVIEESSKCNIAELLNTIHLSKQYPDLSLEIFRI